VKISELRQTLTELTRLLHAAGATRATKDLTEFTASLQAFQELTLSAFVKLAEAGRRPPEPRKVGGGKTDVEALRREIKDLYARASSPDVTEEDVRTTCDRLANAKKLTKKDLVAIASETELVGMEKRKNDDIVTEIRNRLVDLKGAAIRRQMINRPGSLADS
jgi:hypothetical protein